MQQIVRIQKGEIVQEVVEREQWNNFIKEFNHRNELRPTRVEVLGSEFGAQEEEEKLPFAGISVEFKGSDAPAVEVLLGGETAREERHLTHKVPHVKSIVRKVGDDSREDALLIEDESGTKTILRFEALPELEHE